MKKQVRKLTKKIIILTLATSLVVTSCFSHKKIEAHAMGAVATALTAWTLYDVCLYIGGLAVTALGIGYVYDNRDEIAQFGKTVIDSMGETVPEAGWMIGSYVGSESCVYGTEVFEAVQNVTWDYIEAGGLTPSTATDLTGDGAIDIADRDYELSFSKYWTTTAGLDVITDSLAGIYDSWVNKEEDNVLDAQYGAVDALSFNGFVQNEDGNYVCHFKEYDFTSGKKIVTERTVTSSTPFIAWFYLEGSSYYYGFRSVDNKYIESIGGNAFSGSILASDYDNGLFSFTTDAPVVGSKDARTLFLQTRELTNVTNISKTYRIADWIDEEGAWMDTLEDIAVALRPLQDVSDIAGQLSSAALELSATADIYRDLVLDLTDVYVPSLDVVVDPVYWPETNVTPKLDVMDLPNAEVANPDIPMPDGPGSEDPDDSEIVLDTNGLLSLFNILLYIIMIIIMLIYLFLACLAFIVMIFRIPASSSMLPEEMVMGLEHLKSIMIPGMNISIYGFAMALIYLFIVFAIVKALRLEINHFRIPRSYK